MTDLILDASASATGSASTSTRSTFQENYDTFLQLLTTQLQNQNPTDPMDTNEFTQQVVSYSALEQQINTNTQLEQLIALTQSFASGNAIAYVGDIVSYEGARATLESGRAEWDYEVSRSGTEGTIEIRDAAGQLVKTDVAEFSAGNHTYIWDGRMDNGGTAPNGSYTISVVVRDSDGAAISVNTAVTGRVDAVDFSGDLPRLVVGDRTINISDVLRVEAVPAT